MLSNAATPRYYAEFRARVLSGEIPVCHEIELEMNRIDDRVRNPSFYYDDLAVEGFIRFCESEMTLTDGQDLVLLDSFKLWAEEIFGWWYLRPERERPRWAFRETQSQTAPHQQAIHHRCSRRSQVSVRDTAASVFSYNRYHHDHADHYRPDHETGRGGHAASSNRHDSEQGSAVLVPDRR